ncbi:outer membrane lipoprotein carrier protein LolA [Salibacteraceae bacterium]|nr:outer membrane lipoprotein carrier protein LolA [Salibacteraceae bacterium]
MKNLLPIISLMLLANLGISQHEEKDLNPQDPKAQEILDALSNKAAGYTSFSADFEYTLLNKSEGINETQSGSVTMKGKQKYKLEVAGQEIISDGETVWTFIKEVGELQISDVPEESEEDGNLMNPANAFHMYKKGFKYRHEGTASIDGIEADVIKMFPMNPKGKNYHTVVVNIDKAKLELVSMVVKTKDGNEYTYRLKNFKSNIDVNDSDFEFDEDQADDIIDLRE